MKKIIKRFMFYLIVHSFQEPDQPSGGCFREDQERSRRIGHREEEKCSVHD